MKKLAIIIAVLLLLAGAGAGLRQGLLREPASAASAAEAKAPPSFLTLPAMSVPVIHDDQVGRIFALLITLELGSADDEAAVKAAMPRLVDAFLTELHALLGRRLMAERNYDLNLVKSRLLQASARVLGPGHVTGILIKAIDQHRS